MQITTNTGRSLAKSKAVTGKKETSGYGDFHEIRAGWNQDSRIPMKYGQRLLGRDCFDTGTNILGVDSKTVWSLQSSQPSNWTNLQEQF